MINYYEEFPGTQEYHVFKFLAENEGRWFTLDALSREIMKCGYKHSVNRMRDIIRPHTMGPFAIIATHPTHPKTYKLRVPKAIEALEERARKAEATVTQFRALATALLD